MIRNFVIVIFLIGFYSCGNEGELSTPNFSDDQFLAEVYDQKLHIEDLLSSHTFPPSSEDSIKLLKKLTYDWVKDRLFLEKAEAKYLGDPSIEKLVAEYHNSLIAHEYEKYLINNALDTVVTDFDLQEHYNENKGQYSLEKSIIQCLFLKVRKPVKQAESIREWIAYPSERNLQYLRKFCMNNANYCLVNPSKWYKWDDIKDVFPEDIQNAKITTGFERNFSDFRYQYFFRVIDYVSKTEDAPLTYFEERARKLIIRERKNRLLDELKNALFEKEKDTRHVKINIE